MHAWCCTPVTVLVQGIADDTEHAQAILCAIKCVPENAYQIMTNIFIQCSMYYRNGY